MDTEEKQLLCKNILRKIINLRATIYETSEIYLKCRTAISESWDKGLAEFIDNEFFNPVIEKYSELYKKNCATFASIPLKLKSPYKMMMVSSDNMTIFTSKSKIPTALLWCGIGRVGINNHTDLESITVVKLQDPREESEKIIYCKESHVLDAYNFTAFVHLLKNSTYEEQKASLSEVSQAFFTASLKLRDYSFRKKVKNNIKISKEINEKDFRILEKILNSNKIKKEIETLEKYDKKTYQYNYSSIIEELYEDLQIDLKPFVSTDLLKKYTFERDKIHLFDLIIDLTSSANYLDAHKDKDNGPALWLGESDGGILGRYKNLVDANFVLGLVLTYIVLMSDMSDEGLQEIEKVIPEAKKQYLSYLDTMLTVVASFNAQMLTSYL